MKGISKRKKLGTNEKKLGTNEKKLGAIEESCRCMPALDGVQQFTIAFDKHLATMVAMPAIAQLHGVLDLGILDAGNLHVVT